MAGEKRKEEEIAEVPDPVSWRLAEWADHGFGHGSIQTQRTVSIVCVLYILCVYIYFGFVLFL